MVQGLDVNRLHGRRVLVVEDEYMMADDLRRELEKVGAEVLGPVPIVQQGLDLLERESRIDGAILDVNLRDERVLPVADLLRQRGVPFVFLTGYDRSVLPDRYADVPRCEKPIEFRQVIRALFR